jgi:hypothetical protein
MDSGGYWGIAGRRTRRRRILRPSRVHDRSQPVQPRRSPHRGEVFPVRPSVPPQTQESPSAALGVLRTILRTTDLDTGRVSWRTNM